MSSGFSPWDLNLWTGVPGIPVICNYWSWNSRERSKNAKIEHCDYWDWSGINDMIGKELYDKYAKIRSKDYNSLYNMNRTSGINAHAEVVEKVYEQFYGKPFKELWNT